MLTKIINFCLLFITELMYLLSNLDDPGDARYGYNGMMCLC